MVQVYTLMAIIFMLAMIILPIGATDPQNCCCGDDSPNGNGYYCEPTGTFAYAYCSNCYNGSYVWYGTTYFAGVGSSYGSTSCPPDCSSSCSGSTEVMENCLQCCQYCCPTINITSTTTTTTTSTTTTTTSYINYGD